ncbi:hypothetical protein CORC01_08248 [Colletotrichum orchidophilum]|uniref:Uncharacterized protein n=1 Tax=Colletotrichum orchidophilum TaxID=1209926 RepID=A0A1G4B5B1_9PEZI|nr:uncharacterized protein CORC01_08248 [Colletotrichum orchidophilum]OHE96485.1 hypothetical protein CORC01_08248 [Colletotrichum orchidophilum]
MIPSRLFTPLKRQLSQTSPRTTPTRDPINTPSQARLLSSTSSIQAKVNHPDIDTFIRYSLRDGPPHTPRPKPHPRPHHRRPGTTPPANNTHPELALLVPWKQPSVAVGEAAAASAAKTHLANARIATDHLRRRRLLQSQQQQQLPFSKHVGGMRTIAADMANRLKTLTEFARLSRPSRESRGSDDGGGGGNSDTRPCQGDDEVLLSKPDPEMDRKPPAAYWIAFMSVGVLLQCLWDPFVSSNSSQGPRGMGEDAARSGGTRNVLEEEPEDKDDELQKLQYLAAA